MKKILITGGAGYIGTVLTNLALKKNFKVIAIDNLMNSKKEFLSKFYKNKNFKFYNCDINNVKEFEKILKKESVNIVVHLAGIVGSLLGKEEDINKIDDNSLK